MQENPEQFGVLEKEFRDRAKLTVDALAGRVGISDRYVYRIENGGQIPSFDIMCKIVQTLSIPGDLVFYPKEKVTNDLDMEEVIHMLYQCDERSLKIVKAVLRVILGEE